MLFTEPTRFKIIGLENLSIVAYVMNITFSLSLFLLPFLTIGLLFWPQFLRLQSNPMLQEKSIQLDEILEKIVKFPE